MMGPALLAAQAVSMSARMGQLQAHAVDEMRVRAEELLARGDPLRASIYLFASMYDLDRHDPARLVALGEELQRGIDRALRPDPADADRADIHG